MKKIVAEISAVRGESVEPGFVVQLLAFDKLSPNGFT